MATQAGLQVVEAAKWPRSHWVYPQLTSPCLILSVLLEVFSLTGLIHSNQFQNRTVNKSYIEKSVWWKMSLPQYFLPDFSGKANHEPMFSWWAGVGSSVEVHSGQDEGEEIFLRINNRASVPPLTSGDLQGSSSPNLEFPFLISKLLNLLLKIH